MGDDVASAETERKLNGQEWTEMGLFTTDILESLKKPKDSDPSDEVRAVFSFWVDTLRDKSRNRVFLSDKRRGKIERAVKLYGVQNCLKAIQGCSYSDFHLGRNQTGTKYDDIELILRDEQHIDRFLQLYEDKNSKDF